jgi:hypothetical protein
MKKTSFLLAILSICISSIAQEKMTPELLWKLNRVSGIGLSKAIINATNFQVNTGILTVDFDFMCYVA